MKKALLLLTALFAILFTHAQQVFYADPVTLEANVNLNHTATVYTVLYNQGADSLLVTFPAFAERGSGGPDDWGYLWIDSDEEGGPTFEWIEISETGTEIEGLHDDNFAGPFQMGFDFPFYGQNREIFFVQSNGVITFDDFVVPFANQPIPTNSEVNDFIAWFWDDLTVDTNFTRCYYKNFDNKVIIQFEKFVHYPGTEEWITAEVILQRGGDIRIMYKQVREGFQTNGATIGLQSPNGEMGLQVAWNEEYVHSEMALRFDNPPGFIIHVDPASFVLPPQTQEHVWITYSSEGFEVGTYYQDLKCVVNDSTIAPVIIANIMHVVNPHTAGFKGYVTDAVTGHAINECKVRMGEHHVFTNDNGWYELPLEPGVYDVQFIKNGYQTLVVEDTTAVEGFSTLDVQMNSFYFIAGQVWAGENFVPDAFSYLYKMTENGTVVDIFADLTGDLGWFEYPELSSAFYIIKAEPNPNSSYYGNFLPTYYGDVLYWEDATVIHLTGSTDDADIHLVAATDMPQGTGSISGTVTNESDQPLTAGVAVILQLSDTEEAAVAYTDAEGAFIFEGLGYADYRLFADIIGKTTVPMEITLNEGTPSVSGISMVVTSQQVIFLGMEESEFVSGLSKPFPNPVTGQVSLVVNMLKPATLRVDLVDLMGRTIMQQTFTMINSGKMDMDLSGLPAGIYSIRISDPDQHRMGSAIIKK